MAELLDGTKVVITFCTW